VPLSASSIIAQMREQAKKTRGLAKSRTQQVRPRAARRARCRRPASASSASSSSSSAAAAAAAAAAASSSLHQQHQFF
jgi:hypothetical protein